MNAPLLKLSFLCPLILLASSASAQIGLWGMTSQGGTNNHGTIGYYDPLTSEWTTKFNFAADNPGIGARPFYANLVEANGKMYGVTSEGGLNDGGVLFEWDPATNVYSKKVDFEIIGTKGWDPRGSLTYAEGKLYGLTMHGGAHNLGVLFEWDPVTNVYTKKFDFDGTNGSVPRSTLAYKDGKLYGYIGDGGPSNGGVLFEWNIAANTFTKKRNLNWGDATYSGAPIYYGGKFYIVGNGIFEWDPVTNNYVKKLESTTLTPVGRLTLHNDKFYGMTGNVIHEWDPATNIYTKKIDNLATVVGSGNIQGSLTYLNGKFYGMSYDGGTVSNGATNGTLFEWDPVANVATKKIDLAPATGTNPYASLTSFAGKLYGMTYLGGTNSDGVIFEWDPATNNYVKKVDFTSSKGSGYMPQGSLSFHASKFYGMTTFGGELISSGSLSGHGVLFEWDPITKIYSKKKVLYYEMGRYPRGNLSYFNGKLYGMTSSGSYGTGVIFEWDPSTNVYVKKVEFPGVDGSNPYGSLTLADGKFYGMAGGGANNKGVIFEFNPSTGVYTKKIDFNGTNGGSPMGSLTYHDGKFYGMTSRGGSTDWGVIFEWNPSTNEYTKKIDLVCTSGCRPEGSLTYYAGKFYGLTADGGMFNGFQSYNGVIFEWDPVNNTYTKKVDFGPPTGTRPYGSMTVSGGKLYGFTTEGGASNQGILFEWDPVTNAYTKKIELDLETGGRPVYSQLLDVTVQDQVITFEAIPTKVHGGADFTLSAFSSSGLPVSYESSNTNVATITGNVVKIIGRGTSTITAKQPGDIFYRPAADVQQTLAVKETQTITFPPISPKTMGDPPFTLTAVASSNLPVSYTTTSPTITIDNTQVTLVAAGKATIKASQAGDASFIAAEDVSQTFCVNPEKPTITISNSDLQSYTLTSSASVGNQWFKGGSVVVGANSPTLSITANGVYSVEVTIEGCKSERSDGQTVVVTGDISTVGDKNFSLYPNPAKRRVMVDLQLFTHQEEVEIRVYDISGRAIDKRTSFGGSVVELNTESYATGKYVVKAIHGDKTSTQKFVVE